jgi:hypothetical protein
LSAYLNLSWFVLSEIFGIVLFQNQNTQKLGMVDYAYKYTNGVAEMRRIESCPGKNLARLHLTKA